MNKWKKENRKARQAQAAGEARAAHTQQEQATNPAALKSALKDYFSKPKTSSAHVFNGAVEAGYGYDRLQNELKLPTHSIELLKQFRDSGTVGRKGISLEIPGEIRKPAIVKLAQYAGVTVPAHFV